MIATRRPGDPRGLAAGLLFMAIGGAGLAIASEYRIGRALHMGPGYFPVAVALLLTAVGALVVIRAWLMAGAPFGRVAVRPVLAITAAVLLFAAAIDPLGLVPSAFAAALLACVAARPVRLVQAVVLSAALALGATGIFIYGLRLPLTLFGTVLG